MGIYTLTEPCVIGGRHYVTLGEIEVNDDLAAPLVEAGPLKPYRGTMEEPAEAGDSFVEAGKNAADEFAANLQSPPAEGESADQRAEDESAERPASRRSKRADG